LWQERIIFKKMRHIIFFHRSKASKVCCIGIIVLISFFISGCASNNSTNSLKDTNQSNNQTTISSEEIEQYRNNQKKWLLGLEEGLSPEDTLKQVFSYLQYSFQIKKNGKFYQYFEGKYPVTEVEFGLLFENERLTNLLLGKAVWDFSWYRYDYSRVWGHLFQYWLPNGLQEGLSLIRQNNRLGDNYDDVISAYPKQAVKVSGGASDASEAIITGIVFAPFVPIALAAMPFVPEEEITEEHERITKTHEDKLRKLANELELGVTTTTELKQLLGAPEYRGGSMWNYPHLKFGIANGIVIWSESWSKKKLQ
jgi:hypothetical protein